MTKNLVYYTGFAAERLLHAPILLQAYGRLMTAFMLGFSLLMLLKLK